MKKIKNRDLILNLKESARRLENAREEHQELHGDTRDRIKFADWLEREDIQGELTYKWVVDVNKYGLLIIKKANHEGIEMPVAAFLTIAKWLNDEA